MAESNMDDPKRRSPIKQWGAISAIRAAIAWRLRTLLGLHIYGIHTRALSGPDAEPVGKQGYSHRMFEPAEVDLLLACTDNPRLNLDDAFVRAAFSKGDACSAVFFNGELISYNWMAFTPTHHVGGVYVDFSAKHRYGYHAFTLPEFRGRHAIRLFKAISDGYCVQRGRVSTIAFIAIDNDSSMRYALGTGYRRIGFAGYLKLGSLFIPFRTSRVREEGFKFFMPRDCKAVVRPQSGGSARLNRGGPRNLNTTMSGHSATGTRAERLEKAGWRVWETVGLEGEGLLPVVESQVTYDACGSRPAMQLESVNERSVPGSKDSTPRRHFHGQGGDPLSSSYPTEKEET
jgi:hypothetical protein